MQRERREGREKESERGRERQRYSLKVTHLRYLGEFLCKNAKVERTEKMHFIKNFRKSGSESSAS